MKIKQIINKYQRRKNSKHKKKIKTRNKKYLKKRKFKKMPEMRKIAQNKKDLPEIRKFCPK